MEKELSYIEKMKRELSGLEKQKTSRRKENSFYIDMPEMKRFYGSANITGKLSSPTYHLDSGSQKIICTRL